VQCSKRRFDRGAGLPYLHATPSFTTLAKPFAQRACRIPE
jgi:hypothetical protein